jgi:hypothetical protein
MSCCARQARRQAMLLSCCAAAVAAAVAERRRAMRWFRNSNLAEHLPPQDETRTGADSVRFCVICHPFNPRWPPDLKNARHPCHRLRPRSSPRQGPQPASIQPDRALMPRLPQWQHPDPRSWPAHDCRWQRPASAARAWWCAQMVDLLAPPPTWWVAGSRQAVQGAARRQLGAPPPMGSNVDLAPR